MRHKRILTIDGGGIYGLVSARWLRKLCEKDPAFLNGEVWLFAGCSSGAVNSLLLATHDRPREVVLDGVLERFWHDPGTFSNTDPDPLAQMLSWLTITGWFGEQDFLQLLQRHFKNEQGAPLTLGDLKQRVLISTFNWTGGTPVFPAPREPGVPAPTPLQAMTARAMDIMKQYMSASSDPADHARTSDGQVGRGWKPYLFTNLEEGDRHYSVAEVAYGAATPPGFRALRGGIGDGASFSASPTTDAIGFAVKYGREKAEQTNSPAVHDLLDDISLLSLGDGTAIPHYMDMVSSDLGFGAWGALPANPHHGGMWPPTSYALQPAEEASKRIASVLLGDGFHRVNPELMQMPTVVAAYMARWPAVREAMLQRIEEASDGPISEQAVDAALAFLRAEGWLGGGPTRWTTRPESP